MAGHSVLTGLRARTQLQGHSLLTRLRAQNAATSIGHSTLTRLRAQNNNVAHSQLTGLRAQNLSGTGPTAVITGPTVADVGDTIVLSLGSSFGGTFTGYVWSQLSGPTAAMTPSGNQVSIVCPAAKPNAANYPDDVPLQMVFQGVVQVAGGAISDGATWTVNLYAHLTWAANNTAMYWHITY